MKKIIHLIYIIIFIPQILSSQNLYNTENSIKYANYLFDIKDYISAAKEYERIIIIEPDSIAYKTKLIISYKYSGQNITLIKRIEDIFGVITERYPNDIINIYFQTHLLIENYEICNIILSQKNSMSIQEKSDYKFALLLLEKKYLEAKYHLKIHKTDTTEKYLQLQKIYYENEKIKLKKPLIASILSIIIPGLGKIYTKDIKNGIGVLTIVGLSAWQSYRGFNQEGLKNFYGWGFGALAAGFYIGNIYGSQKSAKRENIYQETIINKKIKKVVLNTNFEQ